MNCFRCKKLLSLFLVLVMCLSLFPAQAFADELLEPEAEPPAHEHAFTASVTAPTCTEQGYTTYACECGYSYVGDYTEAAGHQPADVAEVPATTEAPGTAAGKKCAVCGAVLEGCGELPKIETDPETSDVGEGHTHEYSAAVTAPTCTEQGYTTHTCACDESYVDSYTDPLGHDWVSVAEIPATETEPGRTAGVVCSRCGEVQEGCEVIPVLGTDADSETVETVITITQLPEDAEPVDGQVTFSVSAEVNTAAELQYQWQRLDESVEYADDEAREAGWENIDNETAAELILSGLEDEAALEEVAKYAYRCELTAGEAEAVTEELHIVNLKLRGIKSGVEVVASGTCGDGINWELDSNGTLTISGSGNMTNYSSKNDVPWFDNAKAVGNVIITDGVTSIGSYAFSYCEYLHSVIIPESVTSIGQDSFYYCKNLTNVAIPSGLTSIGSDAFYYCIHLRGLTLPSSVTSIGGDAFKDCYNFKSAGPIGSGCDIQFGWTESIPSAAFSGCRSLTSVTIPQTVTHIGNYAFRECALTSINLPDGLRSIGGYAFLRCSVLSSLNLPKSVASIGESAFSGCNKLTSAGPAGSGSNIQFGWTEEIPENAFSGLSVLTSVVLPESISGIGRKAFFGCNNLTSITIPGNVTNIDEAAFYNCGNLSSVYFKGSETQWRIVSIGPNNSPLLEATIHYTTSTPGASGTCGSNLTWILDDVGILTISGYGDMYDEPVWNRIPNEIKTVILPGGLTSIGANSFQNCIQITSVTIPDDVISIGESAFSGCSGLTSITIPDSVTSIGESAFSGCNGLTSVTIPDSVTSIGERAFSGCSGLTGVKIPASVTSLGMSVFIGCSSLVTIETPVFGLGFALLFGGIDWSDNENYVPSTLRVVVLNRGESIPELYFDRCSRLTSISIPQSITQINNSAFADCSALTDFYYEGTHLQWLAINLGSNTDSQLESAIKHFSDIDAVECRKIKDGIYWLLTVDGTLNICGSGALPDWTSSIPPWSGASISNVVIEDGITHVGKNAFDVSKSLTCITIPTSVTSIGDWAFFGCDNLLDVYYSGLETQWNGLSIGVENDDLLSASVHFAPVISFDANGGDNVPETQIKPWGQSLILSTTIPLRPGFDFVGWATSASSTSAQYQPGDDYLGTTSLTLYAVWSIKTYTISYDANGGENSPASQIKTHGITLTLSSVAPTRTGYTFIGWATSPGTAEAAYQPGGRYAIEEDLTLFAVWQGVPYTISYDANGGENVPAQQTKIHGTTLALSSVSPTRANYNFIGWATSPEATSAQYQAGEQYTAEGDATLYAVWQGLPYTIEYNPNGGMGEPEAQIKFHGTTLSLSSATPTREGYDFLGWAASADATEAAYQPGTNYDIEGDVILYAVWQLKTYFINYHANGGAGAPEAQTKTHGVPLILSDKEPTRKDHAFLGWALSENTAEAEFQPKDEYTNDGNVTLYAVWLRTAIDSGDCGDNLTWRLDNNGLLTISGTGAMTNYSVDDSAPWFSQRDKIRSVVIEEGTTNIGDYAFRACVNLNRAVLPESLLSIGDGAFFQCSNLAYVNIPGNVTSIGDSAFGLCSRLTSITIPDSVSSIGGGAFMMCSCLNSVTLSSALTSIPESAFYHCDRLMSIALPPSVASISGSAFGDCSALTNILIPSSMESIGRSAFNGCYNLADVYYGGNQKQWAALIANYTENGNERLSEATLHTSWFSVNESCIPDAVFRGFVSQNIDTNSDGYLSEIEIEAATVINVEGLGIASLEGIELFTSLEELNCRSNSLTALNVSRLASLHVLDCSCNQIADLNLGSESPLSTLHCQDNQIGAIDLQGCPYLTVLWCWGNAITQLDIGPARELVNAYAHGTTELFDGGIGYFSDYTDLRTDTAVEIISPYYQIRYSANGGEGAPEPQIKVNDEPLLLTLDTPYLEGNNFLGWATSKDATEIEYQPGDVYLENEAVTLYAVWEIKTYIVTYDANGGNTIPEAQGKTHGIDLTLSSDPASRLGYIFLGWAAAADATAAQFQPGDVYTAESDAILYAVWEPITYTIKLNANGAKGTASALTVTAEDEEVMLSNRFSLPYNSFVGWNTAADGSGSSVGVTALVQDLILLADEDYTLTLYAQWELIHYSIAFDPNGGEGGMEPIETVYGTAVALTPNAFTREGYVFTGWNTKANGKGTTYKDGSYVFNLTGEPETTVTFYAQWKANTYKVVFDGTSATSGSMKAQVMTYDKPMALTANAFKKTNWQFVGWALDPEAAEPVFADREKALNLTAEADATVTLYAVWAKNSYRIVFNANGGTGDMSEDGGYCEFDGTYTLPENRFERHGFDFLGWATSAKGKVVYADRAEITGLTKTNGKVINLYGVWSAHKYSIAFDGNGATSGSMKPMTNRVCGTTYTLTANAFKRTGYTFLGWSEDPMGAAPAYKNKEKGKNFTTDGVVTLYAVWTPTEYKITYKNVVATDGNTNPESYRITDGTIELQGLTRPGCEFAGWYLDAKFKNPVTAIEGGSTGAKTLYAKWEGTANTYTVVFAPNGGSGKMSALSMTCGTAKALTANAFKRTGYSFAGWTDGNGNTYKNKQKVLNLSETSGDTVTLYAVWAPVEYKITYKNICQFDTNNNPSVYSLEDPVDFRNLAAPERPGCVFGGWYTDAKFKKPAETAAFSATGAKTLYAKWMNKVTYTVAFDNNADKATGKMTPMTKCVSGTVYTLKANAYKRTGYTFLGWSTDKNAATPDYLNKAKVGNLTPVNGETVILYAVWKPIEYTITYKNVAGVRVPGKAAYTVEEEYVLPTAAELKKEGYVFLGWYTTSNFKAGTRIDKIGPEATGAKTLYAKWMLLEG